MQSYSYPILVYISFLFKSFASYCPLKTTSKWKQYQKKPEKNKHQGTRKETLLLLLLTTLEAED